ncbi:hypothetical protein GTQ99_00655 [Kineococcus sp. T13]|uniref:hypothetical protein n=1 Tax=Kineococcus vitellinus TaxID=2696565 RepID=UPI0014122977|nr:hypothetical protein [Kineococcus vitellinus]NAZ73942.1 hypothetical protein [Kineococcus vitellinus]
MSGPSSPDQALIDATEIVYAHRRAGELAAEKGRGVTTMSVLDDLVAYYSKVKADAESVRVIEGARSLEKHARELRSRPGRRAVDRGIGREL